MIEEKIKEVFPSKIKYLNEEGWSIVQVIGINYNSTNKVRIKYQEEISTVGLPLFEEEHSLICLIRKVS